MRASILAIAALAVLLTGCAGPVAPTVPDETASPATLDDGVEVGPAVDLVGVWKVSNADGEGDDTYLRLAEEVIVWSDCGTAAGIWAARNDAFIASFDEWSLDYCDLDGKSAARWLLDATGYGYVDGNLSLLDSTGEPLATLTKDGRPRDDWSTVYDYGAQPVLSEISHHSFEDSVPLPGEAVPAKSIVGRWLPTDYAGDGPFVEFSAKGGYVGSDGCNRVGGRWAMGARGDLLTTHGGTTLMACEGSGAANAVGGASLVGMVGDELTLYNASGSKLASFVRG